MAQLQKPITLPILLFADIFHKLVPDFTHFVADSAKLPDVGVILIDAVF